MGRRANSKKVKVKIISPFFLFFAIVVFNECNEIKNKSIETDYEEVIICGYRLYNQDTVLTSGGMHYQINLLAHNLSDYKNVFFFIPTVTYIEKYGYRGNALEDYPDTIYINRVDFTGKFKYEFSKDTLSAFYMPIGGRRIDLSSNVGALFYYCDECPYEEKLKYGILLESKIFDTVFNNILHVKRCLHYSLTACSPFDPFPNGVDKKWHFYYDVDRCMFVQIEIWDIDTNTLIYVSNVYKANKIDSVYFNKNYKDAIYMHATEEDTVFMPMICY